MILTVTLNAAIDKRYEVEDMRTGKVNRVLKCTYGAGGKGLNVSRIAVLAGEEVTATGFVGGHTGDLIEDLAGKDGIRTDFVHTLEESRTCINILDTKTRVQTEFLEGGAVISKEKAEKMREKYDSLLEKADVVTISGSVPKGIDSGMYLEMIEKARARQKPVLLDTSGRLLQESLKGKPTLIKPNQDEIAQLTGSEISDESKLIQAGRAILEQGVPYVVISLGADGSMLFSKRGIFRAQVPRLAAVNTVGCGDSMLAGLAIGIKRGWEEAQMLQYAGAISAANALRRETGYFVQADFEALYPRVTVQTMKNI